MKITIKKQPTRTTKPQCPFEITLLSEEEYNKFKNVIPMIEEYWWLRTPGHHLNASKGINNSGCANFTYYVYNTLGVRPVIKILLPNTKTLSPGDKLKVGNNDFTILSLGECEVVALCDEVIARRRFDPDNNNWEESELKRWLETEYIKEIIGSKSFGNELKVDEFSFCQFSVLSVKDYHRHKDIIPLIEDIWWLRTAGIDNSSVYVVDKHNENIYDVRACLAVRPVLSVFPTINRTFERGNKVKIGSKTWTVLEINKDHPAGVELVLLCDEALIHRPFDARYNDWSDSELNRWLHTYGLSAIGIKE